VKADESISLEEYWVVGFTGHRQLTEPEEISRAISAEIENIRRQVKGKLAALSSIARGGDTLFAQIAIQKEIPWFVLLPFEHSEFKKDFNEIEWAVAEECLLRAVKEEVLLTQAVSTDAYSAVGRKTVDQANVVLAVWDGAPAQGQGGTAEIVEYVRRCKKPLIWIHAKTLAVSHENGPLHSFGDRSSTQRKNASVAS